MKSVYDYIIVGGGIVGVSTAWQLQQRHPDKSILLVEKESGFAQHQTGHNSGVIHAGVYYAPGSLKADFCKRGVERTISFCAEHDIPVENCGKLLVATNEQEVERMNASYERCHVNGIDVKLLDEVQLKLAEPNITGLGAIYVKTTSIVDYRLVTEQMAEEFKKLGGQISLRTKVVAAEEKDEEVQLTCISDGQTMQLNAKFLVTCSGLMADRMTKMMSIPTDFQIILIVVNTTAIANTTKWIILFIQFPPDLPFLGVHLTRMIDGSVTVGPNAVQGWKREGYDKVNFSLQDTMQMLSFSGFWKVTQKHLKTGLDEFKNSWWKPGYLKLVNKYCPSIKVDDLKPYPAGIRAQAVLSDGSLVHDFLFAESARSLHVCNAPSPAATSAMPIGEYICDKVNEKIEAKTV
ncbi:LOW QUALITY PROTEIN: L-2-hydroxyglutarate oxidase [Vibrio sp. JCM 19053]|nr:LOW QUALITY PROTEIN: L-2-hydroxyglutarate oxidase [Vibrio sp. JCM 19053]